MASYPIYQFYSELCSCTPKTWRRFQAAGNITMAQLGYIVMTLYEMRARHPFFLDVPMEENFALYAKTQEAGSAVPAFHAPFWRFALEEDSTPESIQGQISLFDASSQKMKSVLHGCPGERLSLTYGHDNSWTVRLTLESVIVDKALPGRMLPRALEGEGYGILEDCGGPEALNALAEAFQAQTGAADQDCVPLDLSVFDIEDMNYRLKKIPRIYRGRYEYGYELTQRSLGLLERDYLKNP